MVGYAILSKTFFPCRAVQGKCNEHQGEGEPIAFVRFLFSRLNYTIKGVSECRADKMVSFLKNICSCVEERYYNEISLLLMEELAM